VKVIPLEKTALTLPDVAELAKDGTVILTQDGKPLAAVKNLSGSDWESVALANSRQFRALIEESRRSYREQGGISAEEVRRQLGLKAQPAPSRRKKKS
jgi:hypothetical protein